jgi:hypothetical protein
MTLLQRASFWIRCCKPNPILASLCRGFTATWFRTPLGSRRRRAVQTDLGKFDEFTASTEVMNGLCVTEFLSQKFWMSVIMTIKLRLHKFFRIDSKITDETVQLHLIFVFFHFIKSVQKDLWSELAFVSINVCQTFFIRRIAMSIVSLAKNGNETTIFSTLVI